jgi:hypothetical protein
VVLENLRGYGEIEGSLNIECAQFENSGLEKGMDGWSWVVGCRVRVIVVKRILAKR